MTRMRTDSKLSVKIRPKNFKKVLSNEGYAKHTPTLRKPKFRFIREIRVLYCDVSIFSYKMRSLQNFILTTNWYELNMNSR